MVHPSFFPRPYPRDVASKRRRRTAAPATGPAYGAGLSPAFTGPTSSLNSRSSIESPLSPGPPAGWLAFLQFRATRCQGHARASGHPVPVCEPPQVRVPAGEIVALEAIGHSRGVVAPDHRDHHDVLREHVVHPDEQGRPLDRVHLALGGLPEPVVLVVPPSRRVARRPLVLLRADLGRREV